MKKKFLIFLFLILLQAPPIFSQTEMEDPIATEIRIGQQIEAIPQTAPSEEVNYVEESELARKMKQAKKAHDAKTYDSFGGGITLISMCIVVGALIILSLLFYIFGNISSWFLTHKKKQAVKIIKKEGISEEDHGVDSGEVIAAITAALAQHFAVDHDMQDTILTIKRMRKAYSPWNSKIYNMRHEPQVVHSHPKLGDR